LVIRIHILRVEDVRWVGGKASAVGCQHAPGLAAEKLKPALARLHPVEAGAQSVGVAGDEDSGRTVPQEIGLELDERRLAVILGDVAGKGLPAAMLMASVLGSMRALCSAGLRGCELIAALNKHVRTNTSGDRLVTLFYGELDTSTGEIAYVNAGHNPPILLRSDGRVDRLQPTARVLGVLADALVESRQVEIKPADRLLLFTDGLTEAVNKKDQEYGEQRLTESFTRLRALPSSTVGERLMADVLSFCGSLQPFDDMTLMLVERQLA